MKDAVSASTAPLPERTPLTIPSSLDGRADLIRGAAPEDNRVWFYLANDDVLEATIGSPKMPPFVSGLWTSDAPVPGGKRDAARRLGRPRAQFAPVGLRARGGGLQPEPVVRAPARKRPGGDQIRGESAQPDARAHHHADERQDPNARGHQPRFAHPDHAPAASLGIYRGSGTAHADRARPRSDAVDARIGALAAAQ